MTCKFYTLLYLDHSEKRLMGGRTLTADKRIDVFVGCACMLDKSLPWAFGEPPAKSQPTFDPRLTILTNDKAAVGASLRRCGHDVAVEEIPFSLNVPKGIPFYSAHYKIDAFRYLALRPDNEYSILLDSDVVALRPANEEFRSIVAGGYPLSYTLPNYGNGTDQKIGDCRRVAPEATACEWTGGELWGG